MNTDNSDSVNWSEITVPISTKLFHQYTYDLIETPLECLGINETVWLQCRSFAVNLSKKGFVDPISILYTSFLRLYSNDVTLIVFTRWLLLNESNRSDFKINTTSSTKYHPADRIMKTVQENKELYFTDSLANFEQIWFLIPISLPLSGNGCSLIPNFAILNSIIPRTATYYKRANKSRLHCILAITPSGRYSNQLIVYKSGRSLNTNRLSTAFTRIIETNDGEVSDEHLIQWLEDFCTLPYVIENSAIIVDPRTTMLTPDFEISCQKHNIHFITTEVDSYTAHIVSPLFSLFDKQWAEANRIDRMHYKPMISMDRIVHTIWFTLRTLKRDEQINKIFHNTIFWKNDDKKFVESLQPPPQNLLPKKKKKKTLVKIGSKTKLCSTTMMSDPPSDSTHEQILSYVLNRQLSIPRASKYFGGMKIDYLKYCLSYKASSPSLNGSSLLQLNAFMQSKSTIDWLRNLRTLYFWPCAKQLFLREICRLTGIITRIRSMNVCINNNIGSIKSCDLQSPVGFWTAFEDIHHIQLDSESIIDDRKWKEYFRQYLIENDINHLKAQLWTVDTFEFALTKNATILQLPEWNELRPMNATPKVTVIYAFSNDGQATEPHFIFPNSLCDTTINNEHNSYNDLGHLTPQIFLAWFDKYLKQKDNTPIVLVFCSRLPILSPVVLSQLEQYHVYPFGYPSMRTLPFRYLFERRVRNNRSTNLLSELWKKKLLDEQRTHVLKGTNCTVQNIKQHFEQLWPILLNEKRDDDDENKTFQDKCQQAFQQADIKLIVERHDDAHENKHQRNEKKTTETCIDTDELVDQLKNLLHVIAQVREQISSTQILKIKTNHPLVSVPSYEYEEALEGCHSLSTVSESIDAVQSLVTDKIIISTSTNGKRPSDENDEPHSLKRVRLTSPQPFSSTTTTMIQWIPPSNQLVTNLQSQSSSLFQFILSLVHTILTSSESHLTDEHCCWLHKTVNGYDCNYNSDKLNLLIETACIVAKTDLVR